jgi:hypothetical protein
LLFAALLVMPNDLPESLHSSAKLFADDRLLYRQVNTTSDTNKLQEDLDMLQKWESKWQMMCAFQVRSLLMGTPRYLLSSTTSNM